MKNAKINYVMVGSFVLAMIVALIVSIAMISGRTGATDKYYSIFEDVSGIDFGTRVLFDGYHVGQVEDIEPIHSDGKVSFRVDMSVIQGWQIPDDSIVRKEASGLLAAFALVIREGGSSNFLAPDGEIKSGRSANLFEAVSQIANDASDVTQNGLMPLIDNMNDQINKIGKFLDGDVQEILANIRTSTPVITSNFETVSANLVTDLDKISAGLTSSTDNLNAILSDTNAQNIEETIVYIEQGAQNFATLTKDLQGTREKLDHMIVTLDDVVTENRPNVDGTLTDLRYSMKAVARHVDGILRNLDGTSRNMYEFSRQIRLNPALLLSGDPPKDEAKLNKDGLKKIESRSER